MYQYFSCGLCLCFFLWSRLCPLMYPKSFMILLFIFRSVTRMTISPSVLRAVLVSTCCLRIIIHSILFYSIIKCPGWRVNYITKLSIQLSSVAQLCLLFASLWTAAHQASLSITNSWSLLQNSCPSSR